ncbi:MAG: hypothetical protein PARBA_00735 [Parabacteroides sp.]
MEKGTIVTINGNGTVSVPGKVMMQDFEIAELFGVTIPAIRANIRTILKTGIVTGDFTNGATLVGNNILPDYHGLDMVVALAFRIQSPQTEIFRRWILGKATKVERDIIRQPILISIDKSINGFVN